MSEIRVLVSSVSFFLTVSLVLQMAGFSGQESPDFTINNPAVVGATSETTSTIERLTCALFGVASLLSPVCATIVIESEIPVITDIAEVIQGVSGFTFFMFELATFQIEELPPFLTAIIVVPPGVGVAYSGARLVRGGG